MGQLFRKYLWMFLRFLGFRPVAVSLNMENIDETVQKSALTIHAFYNDESIQAVLAALKAEHTRSLLNLASYSGNRDKLYTLQGRMESIQGFIRFIEDAGNLRPDDVRTLRTKRQKDSKAKVLNLGKSRQEVVI